MVLFAMLLFGIMAMAALVIDIGFARLAQRQMQSATDSAALEGLRFRDQFPPSPQSDDLDEARRLQARKVVSQLFDDNLLGDENNLVEDDADSFNFGAGPIVKFRAGDNDGGVYSNEFIYDRKSASTNPRVGSLSKVPVYKPVLATNYAEPQHQDDSRGDMVAGKHDFDQPNPKFDDLPPSVNEFIDSTTGEYENRFFSPVANENAFLVRIRRTGEFPEPDDPLDLDEPPPLATSGPPLPYLFARGSLMFDVDENSSDDPRRLINAGIKVRATSIAALQPVVCVGDSSSDESIRGKLDVAVPIAEWKSGTGVTFRSYTQNAIGGAASAIGEGAALDGVTGYVAIYDPDIDDRVIGFGPALLSAGEFSKQPPFPMSNASAVFCYPFQATGTNDQLVFESRERNREFLYQVPVSVR